MSEQQSWLTRGATSLSLMMKGFDHQLDEKLNSLHAALREKDLNIASFKAALEAVEAAYDDIESTKDQGVENYIKTFEIILADQPTDLLASLRVEQPSLIDLLNLAEPLSRQFRVIAEQTPVATSDAQQEQIRSRLARRFKSIIQTLMMMGESNSSITEIDKLLGNKPTWDSLDSLATKTIDLLNERLNEEKKQFEGYLSELTAKLTRINQIVESDSAILSELKKINIDFNSSINQQMSEARAKIDNHEKMDVLKTDLLVSLDAIANRLEEYQNTYGNRLQEMQANKVEMNSHIQTLEKENLELMSELHKERRLSMLDTLTQLPNRQGFNTRLEEELSRANRYNHYLSVAILDIDFFKRINDDFGHLVGDKVLRMIAKEMKRKCRESDFIARFGGEEFIVILPQTSLQDAKIAIDKLREHVANCPFHYQNKPVPLTLSGGVAEKQADETVESWLDRADSALYESKHNGRNRVSAAAMAS